VPNTHIGHDASPSSLMGLNFKSKGENSRRRRSWGAFPGSQHFRGMGTLRVLGWGLESLKNNSIIHTDLHKLNNKLVSA